MSSLQNRKKISAASLLVGIFLLLTIGGVILLPQQTYADSDGSISLPNPLGRKFPGNSNGVTNLNVLFGNVIKYMLGFMLGPFALLVFVYGGFLWLTSAGNQERITKGKDTMLWATIGIIVVFTSYTALSFIMKALRGPDQGTTTGVTNNPGQPSKPIGCCKIQGVVHSKDIEQTACEAAAGAQLWTWDPKDTICK